MRRVMLLLAALSSALCGCSMSADTELAELSVGTFHAQLDAGQFDTIYAGASDDLKNASKQEPFVQLLGAIHRKLGTVKSAIRTSWNVNYKTDGSFVSLQYTTQYASGEASEQFVFRMRDGKALLAGYHVNSMALVVN